MYTENIPDRFFGVQKCNSTPRALISTSHDCLPREILLELFGALERSKVT